MTTVKDFKKYLEQFDDDLEIVIRHGNDGYADPEIEFIPFDIDEGEGINEDGEDHYLIQSSGQNIRPFSDILKEANNNRIDL